MTRYPGWHDAAAVQRFLQGQPSPAPSAKVRKYRNIPTTYAGLRFDSKREAQRAQELLLLEKAGLITDLVLDKRLLHYDLIVNGQKVGVYEADFSYYENGCLIVEDVKGYRTREYRMKKRLMKSIHGIDIRET